MTLPTERPRARHLLTLLLVAAASTVSSGDASAQSAPADATPPTRSGFHLSVGVGSASVSATCTGCDIDFFQDRTNGFSGRLQIGGALTPRLVLAGEFLGWIKNDAQLNRRIAALSGVLLGYPSASSGFFVKGGVGVLRAVAENDILVVQSDAMMGSTGIGYDVPLGGSALLTPYVTYIRTFATETWANGVVSPVPISPNAIQLGVAITVH